MNQNMAWIFNLGLIRSVSLFVHVDEGTRSGPDHFVIVSTFCEKGPDVSCGFIGINTAIRQHKGVSGQTAENSYRKIGYTIMGTGVSEHVVLGFLGSLVIRTQLPYPSIDSGLII